MVRIHLTAWAVVAQLVRALKRGFSNTRPGLDFLYRQLYTVFVVGADRYLFSDNLRVGGSIPPCGLTGRSSSVVEQQAYNGYLVTRSNHSDLERCTNGRVGRFSVIGIAEIAQPVRAPTKVGGPGFKSQFYTPRVNNTFVHLEFEVCGSGVFRYRPKMGGRSSVGEHWCNKPEDVGSNPTVYRKVHNTSALI